MIALHLEAAGFLSGKGAIGSPQRRLPSPTVNHKDITPSISPKREVSAERQQSTPKLVRKRPLPAGSVKENVVDNGLALNTEGTQEPYSLVIAKDQTAEEEKAE